MNDKIKLLTKAIDEIKDGYDAFYIGNKYDDSNERNTHKEQFALLSKELNLPLDKGALGWIKNCYDRYYKNEFDDEEGTAFEYIRKLISELEAKEGKNREDIIEIGKYKFKNVGVEGIYICDQAVMKARFDDFDCNDWNMSSGKKLLELWFKKHAPAEIQEQFDIDLPTVEEVFSQKMLNWWGGDSVKCLVSKQFPIFKDSDERMKEFDGGYVWWWTRSANAGNAITVWCVSPGGNIDNGSAYISNGFVPMLRKRK